jgi:hypothetical protein
LFVWEIIIGERAFGQDLLRPQRTWRHFVAPPHPELSMPPLHLNDDEMTVLRQLAEPLNQTQRGAFLVAVAAELEAGEHAGAVGIGSVHRVGRVVQRKFFDPPSLPNASPRARA